MWNVNKVKLPTDWDSLEELEANMKEFMEAHPDYTLLPADDPGYNHNPPQEPRLGWVASKFNPETQTEDVHCWTITIMNCKKHRSTS